MKFSEAMKLLEEGKKVRRTSWAKQEYVYYKNYEFFDETNKVYMLSIYGDDWEEYIDKQDIEELEELDENEDTPLTVAILTRDKLNEIIRVVNNINKRLER